MIKVSGLRKSFRGQPVLRGVDLEVPDGSITIIIGRSGEGKSVFLKHLLGLLHPDSGRIEVDATTNRAAFNWTTSLTTAQIFGYHLAYVIVGALEIAERPAPELQPASS